MQVFNLVSALVGGSAIVATGGVGMGLPLSLLDASPFNSYLWPGLILLFIVGGTQGLAVLLHARHSTWTKAAAAVAGFGMIIWIYVEVIILPEYHWLHTIYFTTGTLQLILVLLWLGVLPDHRRKAYS